MLTGTLNDDRQTAQNNIAESQEKQKLRYDASIQPTIYQIGDQVLLRNFRAKKLDAKWIGPFYIHDNRKTNGTYQLRTMDEQIRKKWVHADQLIPYTNRKDD